MKILEKKKKPFEAAHVLWDNNASIPNYSYIFSFIITNKTRTYEIVQKIKVAHHLTDPIGISFEQSVCLNCYIRKLHFQNVRNL